MRNGAASEKCCAGRSWSSLCSPSAFATTNVRVCHLRRQMAMIVASDPCFLISHAGLGSVRLRGGMGVDGLVCTTPCVFLMLAQL